MEEAENHNPKSTVDDHNPKSTVDDHNPKSTVDGGLSVGSLGEMISSLRIPILNSLSAGSLGEMISSLRGYDPIKERMILSFEYFSNLSLRPKQVEILSRLSEEEKKDYGGGSSNGGGFRSIVQQLIMGGGKTKVLLPLLAASKALTLTLTLTLTKVLLPLLAASKARGDNLVIIMVPDALLTTTHTDIKMSSHRAFKQKAHLFEFKRHARIAPESVTRLLAELW